MKALNFIYVAKVTRVSIEVKVVTRADFFITKVAYLVIFHFFGTFKNHFESRLSWKSLLSSISSFLGSDVNRADALIRYLKFPIGSYQYKTVASFTFRSIKIALRKRLSVLS